MSAQAHFSMNRLAVMTAFVRIGSVSEFWNQAEELLLRFISLQ
jgi:hypothetical protein